MELFYKDQNYKNLKKEYEKEYFKLFGKYAWFDGDKISDKSTAEISEYFKNKKVCIDFTEERQTKQGIVSTSKKLTKTFYQIWSEDPNMKEYKEVVFNCDVANVKKYQFNLFTGFDHLNTVKPKEGNLDKVFEHIKSLSNYNDSHYDYILDYLAQLVQYPHILPNTCLIFITEEGVGKDIFSKFLSEVIGDRYSGNTEKLDTICGKFNSNLGGKLLFVINETNPVESKDRVETIKFLITATDLYLEEKYKTAVKCKNFCRFIFFSNRLMAFPVEEGNRRPVIFTSSTKYLKSVIGEDANKLHFDKLVKILQNRSTQKAFLNYLLNRDISKFNPQKFEKSQLHTILEENSVSPIVGFLASIVSNNFDKKVLRKSTVNSLTEFTEYSKSICYKYEMTQKKFNIELESKYKIKKIKSGNQYFEFDIKELKAMLETKYKYNFEVNNELEEDLKATQNISPFDDGIETDNIDYKFMYSEALLKIKKLEDQIKLLSSKEEVKEIEIKRIEVQSSKFTAKTQDDLDNEINLLYSENKPLKTKINKVVIVDDEKPKKKKKEKEPLPKDLDDEIDNIVNDMLME